MFETGDLDFDDDIFESELLDNPVVDSPTKTVIESTSKSTKGVFVKPAAVVRKTHKIVKRKFPGPAGLLPEMRNLNVDLTKLEDSFKENDSSDNNEYFCSQNSVSNFCEDTWLKALDDFQGSTVNLVESYNIAWIKDRAKTGKLINDKAPFLLVLIKKIECVSKPPTFILEDPSGEIEAVISEELYDELAEYLTINSVIVLKQFSVLSMNNSKKLYVNITLKNLIKIYSYRKKFAENLTDVGNTVKEIEILSIQDIPNEQIIKDISNVKEKYRDYISTNRNTKKSITENISNNDNQNSINTDLNISDIDFSDDFFPTESTIEKAPTKQNQILRIKPKVNASSIFETNDFNASFTESSLPTVNSDSPPSKKMRATTSKFMFKSKMNLRDQTSTNKIDSSQVSILSQNKENIDEIKNVFNDLDADMLFDDF